MNKENFNANQYREMYMRMGIDIDKLGCIMLDIENDDVIREIPKEFGDDILMTSKNPARFWIKGFVAGHTPHVTLLYGLIYPICNQLDAARVLEGWKIEDVAIRDFGYFESPYEDEPYYCIVAHVNIDDNLMEGHRRLELLPHINTFPDYKAHITVAYIKKDAVLRDQILWYYNREIETVSRMKVSKINYGKNQSALITNP